MMKLYDLWFVSPQCHVFIKTKDGVKEYTGQKNLGESIVSNVQAKKYPCHGCVLEVILEGEE